MPDNPMDYNFKIENLFQYPYLYRAVLFHEESFYNCFDVVLLAHTGNEHKDYLWLLF